MVEKKNFFIMFVFDVIMLQKDQISVSFHDLSPSHLKGTPTFIQFFFLFLFSSFPTESKSIKAL